jgi:hypothetical protein
MKLGTYDYERTKDGFFIHLTFQEVLDIYGDVLTEEDILRLKRLMNEQSTSSGSSKGTEDKS